MKPATLKELLKSPLSVILGFSGAEGISISVVCNVLHRHLGNKIKDWVNAALEEKYEREYSEPLRWIKVDFPEKQGYQCPKCEHIGWKNYNYCPMCGQELYPPEGVE